MARIIKLILKLHQAFELLSAKARAVDTGCFGGLPYLVGGKFTTH
jgi:hypothetical protein